MPWRRALIVGLPLAAGQKIPFLYNIKFVELPCILSQGTVYFSLHKSKIQRKGGGGMLSDRIGAKVRGSQDAPPLSMAEKLLLAFCAAALVFVCLAGYTQLDRQGQGPRRADPDQGRPAGRPAPCRPNATLPVRLLPTSPPTMASLRASPDKSRPWALCRRCDSAADQRGRLHRGAAALRPRATCARCTTPRPAILSGGPSSASALTDRRARDAAGGRSAGAHRVFAGGRAVQLYERRGLAAAPG